MTADRARALVAGFAPVGLHELEIRAGLQHRLDEKYVVTWSQIEAMAESFVDTHEVLEIADHRVFTYDTIYFDSDSLAAYRAHVQRRRMRFKCRTRRYVETDTNQLQVKLKGLRGATVKHVVDCDPALHGAVDAGGWEFVDQCLRDTYGRVLGDRLEAKLQTTYRRMTFAPPDGAERVTCDFDMTLTAFDGPVVRMRDDRAIVEVKSSRGNGPANTLLHRLGARPVRCSKYCIGVALTHPDMKSNDFRRLMNEHFVDMAGDRPNGSLRSGVPHAAVQARPDFHACG
jgi:hypothetical protein